MEDIKNKIDSFLTFKLGIETFASSVSKVLNIVEMPTITEVPQAPEYMMGVMNLRGTVLPVIDTRIKFGMGATEVTTNTCVLVLEIGIDNGTIMIGAIVDSVEEVMEIKQEDIHESPSIGTKYNSEFILGMVEQEESFIMVLDMDKVFTADETLLLAEKIEEERIAITSEN